MPLHRYLHLQFTYFLYEEFIVLTDAGKIRIKTQIFRDPQRRTSKSRFKEKARFLVHKKG